MSRSVDLGDGAEPARYVLTRDQLLRCTDHCGRCVCARSTLLSGTMRRAGMHTNAIAGNVACPGVCLRALMVRRHACRHLARMAISTQPARVRQRLVLRRGLSRVFHGRDRLGRVAGAEHGARTRDRAPPADAVGGNVTQDVGAGSRASDGRAREGLPMLVTRGRSCNHSGHPGWQRRRLRAPVPGRPCARQISATRPLSCSSARPAVGRGRSLPGSASRLSARWSR